MDFDDGETYHECEEDEREDMGIDMADAMHQASTWGMDDDLEMDAGDDTAPGSAGPVTPLRQAQPPLPLLFSRKRDSSSSSSPALSGTPHSEPTQRRRLFVKTPAADIPLKPIKVVEEFAVDIDGFLID